MAISCVIPACLNTNIQTPQLQNKPGKRGAEEALHCVPQPPRAALPRRWQTPWAHVLPGPGDALPPAPGAHPSSRTAVQSAPHPPPGFPLSRPRESRTKSSSSARNKRGWRWELFPKGVHQPRPGLRPVPQSGDKVLTAPLLCGTNDFPPTALHMVPLASWAPINPFLSWEPAFRVRGTLSSLGEVQSPPSQPLLHHSPLLHGDFWLLLRSTLPSFSARFTLLRHL